MGLFLEYHYATSRREQYKQNDSYLHYLMSVLKYQFSTYSIESLYSSLYWNDTIYKFMTSFIQLIVIYYEHIIPTLLILTLTHVNAYGWVQYFMIS